MNSFNRSALLIGASWAILALAGCGTADNAADGADTTPAETAEQAPVETAEATEQLVLSAAACTPPPVDRCTRGEECGALVIEQGPAVNPATDRNYYLDYSCDLKKGEPVNLVLNLHGAGSYGNWQRHYFPILDYADDYNLVVVTPNAPPQVWAQTDDEHLQTIVSSLIDEIGAENIASFWLAGHSQGGITSRRLVCTPFFEDKVDGMLSLSGGRVGRAELSPDFYRPDMEAGMRNRPAPPPEVVPECDFSHIYATGGNERGAALSGVRVRRVKMFVDML